MREELLLNTEKADKIYAKMLEAVKRFKDNPSRYSFQGLILFVGMVHGLRLTTGYQVPEIEEAFMLLDITEEELNDVL